MKGRENVWFYVEKPLGGGVCPWCDGRGEIIQCKTSDGERIKICKACILAARRISVGSFLLRRTSIPVLIRWRRRKVGQQTVA